MENYYVEFELEKESSLGEITKQLIKQERVWNSRQHVRPEEARKKLVLIDEAKLVFETEERRRRYDAELELFLQEPVKTDSNQEQYKKFRRWLNDASNYFEKRNFDLAESAIEKALSYRNADSEEVDSLGFASVIYVNVEKYDLALKYVNEAIVLDPTIGWNYRYKYYVIRNTKGYTNESKSLIEQYIKIQEGTENKKLITEAYDFASGEFFFGFKNKSVGEELARKALAMDSKCEYAQKVIEELVKFKERSELEKKRTEEIESIRMKIQEIEIPQNPEQFLLYRAAGNKTVLFFLFLLSGTLINSIFYSTGLSWIVAFASLGAAIGARHRFKINQLDRIDQARRTIQDLKSQIN